MIFTALPGSFCCLPVNLIPVSRRWISGFFSHRHSVVLFTPAAFASSLLYIAFIITLPSRDHLPFRGYFLRQYIVPSLRAIRISIPPSCVRLFSTMPLILLNGASNWYFILLSFLVLSIVTGYYPAFFSLPRLWDGFFLLFQADWIRRSIRLLV